MGENNETEVDLLSMITGNDDSSEHGDDTHDDDHNDDTHDDNQNDYDNDDDLPDDLKDAKDRKEDDTDDDDNQNDKQRQRQEHHPRKQPPPQSRNKIDPFNPNVRLQEDRAGNLLDGEGKIIARKGRERQMFERWRKVAQNDRASAITLAQRLTKLANEAKTLYTNYVSLQKQKDIFDEAGLSIDDKRLLLDVASEYKKDPLKGLKLMLTKAHMAGVDIKQLTGADASFDPSVIINSVKEHIDAKFKPVEERTSRERDQEELYNEAKGFFQRNPKAAEVAEAMGTEKFGAIITQAKTRFPNLSLDDIWQKIHYQIILRENRNTTRDTTPVKERRSTRRPPSRNRPAREESFEDIGKSVLRDITGANRSR